MLRERWSIIGLLQASMSLLLAVGAPAQFEAGRPNLGFLMFGTSLGSPAIVLVLETRKYRKATRVTRLFNQLGVSLSPAEALRWGVPEPDKALIEKVLKDPFLAENPQVALEVIRDFQRSKN